MLDESKVEETASLVELVAVRKDVKDLSSFAVAAVDVVVYKPLEQEKLQEEADTSLVEDLETLFDLLQEDETSTVADASETDVVVECWVKEAEDNWTEDQVLQWKAWLASCYEESELTVVVALETVESVVELLEDAVFELGSVVQQLTVDVERS